MSKRVGKSRFKTIQSLIDINREDRSCSLLFLSIQPVVILMIAPHKDERTSCFVEHRGNNRIIGRKVLQKPQIVRRERAMPPGTPIQMAHIRKDAEISYLQQQIQLLAGLLLPASRQLKGAQDLAVDIAKHRNLHDPLSCLGIAAPQESPLPAEQRKASLLPGLIRSASFSSTHVVSRLFLFRRSDLFWSENHMVANLLCRQASDRSALGSSKAWSHQVMLYQSACCKPLPP